MDTFTPADEALEAPAHIDRCGRCHADYECTVAHADNQRACDVCRVQAMSIAMRRTASRLPDVTAEFERVAGAAFYGESTGRLERVFADG